MKGIEFKAIELFNNRFGMNLNSRLGKLNEEVEELNEAIEDYNNAKDPNDRMKKAKHVIEEISDVQAVLTHLSGLFSVDHERLLIDAIMKVEIRTFLPEYKRSGFIIENK